MMDELRVLTATVTFAIREASLAESFWAVGITTTRWDRNVNQRHHMATNTVTSLARRR